MVREWEQVGWVHLAPTPQPLVVGNVGVGVSLAARERRENLSEGYKDVNPPLLPSPYIGTMTRGQDMK